MWYFLLEYVNKATTSKGIYPLWGKMHFKEGTYPTSFLCFKHISYNMKSFLYIQIQGQTFLGW